LGSGPRRPAAVAGVGAGNRRESSSRPAGQARGLVANHWGKGGLGFPRARRRDRTHSVAFSGAGIPGGSSRTFPRGAGHRSGFPGADHEIGNPVDYRISTPDCRVSSRKDAIAGNGLQTSFMVLELPKTPGRTGFSADSRGRLITSRSQVRILSSPLGATCTKVARWDASCCHCTT
jgi:hypothetical protein